MICPRCRTNETNSGYCTSCDREYRIATEADKKKRFAFYGISEEEYIGMLEFQNYRCAICGTDDPSDGNKRTWCIDHDHSCCPGAKSCGNCVRGLLCHRCNRSLGGFMDDPSILKSAIMYLEVPHGVQ